MWCALLRSLRAICFILSELSYFHSSPKKIVDDYITLKGDKLLSA